MPDSQSSRGSRLRQAAPWAVCLLLAACGLAPTPIPPPSTATPPGPITITVIADGQTRRYALPQPLTVREALAQAGIAVGELDRLSPAPFTRLTDGAVVTLTRVTQTFEAEQAVVPFESQTLKNENIPVDSEPLIIQSGANGLEEITYRTVFEDGVQVSRSVIKRVMLTPPTPQIIMVGIQKPFGVVPITGTLAYLSGNNAWVMRGTSGQRTPLTTSGDLDGRVFDLSPDGQRLLFTRAVTEPESTNFNTLWVISLPAGGKALPPISLPVSNTLYAEWSPAQAVTPTIAFSTGEKTTGALGWQANNDLWRLSWIEDRPGRAAEFTTEQILDSSFAGLYGWWGTAFSFAPDGGRLAYAQTDSVGTVDLATRQKSEVTKFVAYNMQSDTRAWHPTVRWGDNNWIYTIVHGGPLDQFELPEFATVFNLAALSPDSRQLLELVPRAGMYSNPIPSPAAAAEPGAERRGRVACLIATDPKNPLLTAYRLAVMDRDGSNLRVIFPPEGQPGIEPGVTPAWSPDGQLTALIYQGNLWLVDPTTGASQQLTGDGLSAMPDWGQ